MFSFACSAPADRNLLLQERIYLLEQQLRQVQGQQEPGSASPSSGSDVDDDDDQARGPDLQRETSGEEGVNVQPAVDDSDGDAPFS